MNSRNVEYVVNQLNNDLTYDEFCEICNWLENKPLTHDRKRIIQYATLSEKSRNELLKLGITGVGKNPVKLSQADYANYLKSSYWQRVRQEVYAVAQKCNRCGGPGEAIHHLSYDRLGQEHWADVVVVCRNCHNHLHKKENRLCGN